MRNNIDQNERIAIQSGMKMMRCSTQLDFLQQSIVQGSIPQGIVSQMKFTPSIQDELLKAECDKIMHSTGSRILDIMICYYQARKERLAGIHYCTMDRLKNTLETAKYNDICSKLSHVLNKERKVCETTHEHKLKRDISAHKKYVPKVSMSQAVQKRTFRAIRQRRKSAHMKKRRVPAPKFRRRKVKGTLPKVEEMSLERLKDTVINLSDVNLTKEQLYLFYLSQSFAPTPGLPNLSTFEKDLEQWYSKLRYRVIFKDQPRKEDLFFQQLAVEKKLTSLKGKKLASRTQNYALELFIDNVNRDAHHAKQRVRHKTPDNLLPQCRKALKQLENIYDDQEIIIRPFDKGTGFFLLHKDDYIQRALQHLNDREKYIIIDDPKKEALEAKNAITAWTEDFYTEPGMTTEVIARVIPDLEQQTCGNIYLNPKAHKPPLYPGRLITTGCNSYVENLSAVTAHELKKVQVPYVIIDRQQFLRKIDSINNSELLHGKDIIHVSVDVVNMFPNIPREFGIQECIKHLNKRNIPHLFSTACIVEGLKITLDYNLATFNGTTYKQTSGTAMGPKNACDYADVAMNYIDQAVHNNNPDTSPCPHVPVDWNRFRDDVYMPWIGSEAQLLEFMDWLNSIHPSLKFTVKYSRDGVEFLDLFVYTGIDNKLNTRLFSKGSDTHSYLTPNSCHKLHMIENIPFNTARRVYQNNSEYVNYECDKVTYTNYLLDRGYDSKFVSDAFERAESLDRQSLYQVKANSSTGKLFLPLVTETNPALPDMAKIINKHKHILALDPTLEKVIPADSLFVSHRSAKTIADRLISSKRPQPSAVVESVAEHNNSINADPVEIENDNLGCKKCSASRCYMCKHFLNESTTFSSCHTEQTFRHKHLMTCSTENVIYMIDCVVHNVSYIGYTTTNIKTRFSNNKSHLKNNNASCEIVKHLMQLDHNIDFSSTKLYDESLGRCLNITLIEKVDLGNASTTAEKEAKCETREGYWQTQLKTLRTGGGLNSKDSRKYVTRRKQTSSR